MPLNRELLGKLTVDRVGNCHLQNMKHENNSMRKVGNLVSRNNKELKIS
jgi:hypothetical protein